MKRKLHFIIAIFLFAVVAQAQTPATITETRETNADGSLVMEGVIVEVSGLSIGPNFRPDGLTFVLFDTDNNIGITIFNNTGDVGYTVADGDDLTIVGQVTQYNGLAEIIPTSITVDGSGNSIPSPQVVNNLGEDTESKLITVHNVTLLDPTQWTGSGSFNVNITNGVNEMQIRVDEDTDLAGSSAPNGTFSVTGIGGQFDFDEPFENGYQIFPRSTADVVEGMVNTTELYQGEISLFPNPASELVTVKAEDAINRISIYDITGQLVKMVEDTNSLAVGELSNGAYVVKAELDGGVWNQRLMIAR